MYCLIICHIISIIKNIYILKIIIILFIIILK